MRTEFFRSELQLKIFSGNRARIVTTILRGKNAVSGQNPVCKKALFDLIGAIQEAAELAILKVRDLRKEINKC